jgi:hypothetical protein
MTMEQRRAALGRSGSALPNSAISMIKRGTAGGAAAYALPAPGSAFAPRPARAVPAG